MKKEFNRHDNIDYEVVEVSKDSLLLRLKECAAHASLPAETIGYFGVALSFFAAVFFTETTRGFWTISGETIQASFLVGGIVTLILAINRGIKWYFVREKYTPESIVNSLSSDRTPEVVALLPAPTQYPFKSTVRKTKGVSKNTKNKTSG